MARFFKAANTYVNLDFVKIIDETYSRPTFTYKFRSKDGAIIAEHRTGVPVYFEELNAQIVSASEDCIAVAIDVETSLGRPNESNVYTLIKKICAWSVFNKISTPIFCSDESFSGTDIYIKMPDGTYELPFQETVNTLDEAKFNVLQRAQMKWDSEHASPERDQHRHVFVLS